MKNFHFPWLALAIGLLIAIALQQSGALNAATENRLPLLTLLVMSEFGFIVTAIGAGLGMRVLYKRDGGAAILVSVLGCLLFAAGFLWVGMRLWPGGIPL